MQLNSDNPELYANLALAFSQEKNYIEAQAVLNAAAIKFPTNAQIKSTTKTILSKSTDEKLASAASFYNMKNYEKAIEIYLQIEPQTAETMLGIASAYQNLEDNANAIEYYKKALKFKKNDTNIAYYIAALYVDDEDYTNAKIYTKYALSYDKNNKQAKELDYIIDTQVNSLTLEKAIAAFDVQDFDGSLLLLNEILSNDSKNSYALYYRGMVYDTKNQLSEAITDYKNANTINPDLKIVNYLIAVNYDTLNKPNEALGYFKKFVSEYGEDDEFKNYAVARIQEINTASQVGTN